MTQPSPRRTLRAATALTALTTLGLLSACSSSDDKAAPSSSASSTAMSSTATAAGSSSAAPSGEQAPAEQRRAMPRLVTTYEGGLMVLDAESLKVLADLPMEGYNRVNPAGDNRHVAVSTTNGFKLFDAGTWGAPHGDHAHFYTSAPKLTDVKVDAKKPGHVVVHDGHTVFFDDGTGTITTVESNDVADPKAKRTEVKSAEAHHGVAVVMHDGTMIRTIGNDKTRVGALAQDASGKEIARYENCPGVHGEAVAADNVVIGCENGAVVFRDGAFHPVKAPDAYALIGNQAGSEHSPISLGDYKTEKGAKLERPRRISLIDTRTDTLKLVDLPASYSFRSLGRGPRGEAMVLGTDGKLHVIDPEAGTITKSIDVVAPWTESETWQDPRPTLNVQGNTAYVTEPASKRIVRIDLLDFKKVGEATLPHATDEVAGATGAVAPGAREDGEHHDEAGHDDHAHESSAATPTSGR